VFFIEWPWLARNAAAAKHRGNSALVILFSSSFLNFSSAFEQAFLTGSGCPNYLFVAAGQGAFLKFAA
jgi:hypothetical protein